MKARMKRWIFSLLGKEPEAVVVSFCSGDAALAQGMCEEIQTLEPSRRHFQVFPGESLWQIRKRLRPFRIGLAPVLFTSGREFGPLRRAAFLLAPRRILAYNARLERHHLKVSSPIASWLFLRGVPLDRIYLRPGWLWPFRKDRTLRATGHRAIDGRPRNSRRKTIAVLTPYFPYPLAHGGAVRMFSLLREVSREFNIILYAFTESEIPDSDLKPVLDLATRVYLVRKPRYREPRWSTFSPPEVGEYRSPEMAGLIAARDADLLQVEYTYLASYGGDILVEHDVTFDLYAQVRARRNTWSAGWDWWRWHRYERRAIGTFARVVVMSGKDQKLLRVPHTTVIENGVDITRFEPLPERPGRQLLFIGSFRHFPNIVAFRFLVEEILPLLNDVDVTVVAGPEPLLHWRNHTGTLQPEENSRVRILEFVADVRPLYHQANVVVVPTLESAGTNVKVLEAIAMGRAVVSTSSGCAGLGVEHGKTIWIADDARDFAAGVRVLLEDDTLRSRVAQAGRAHVEQHFDWRAIGMRQRELFREALGDPVRVRAATEADLTPIAAIQDASPEAARWDLRSYLDLECLVAVEGNAASATGQVAGFLLARQTSPGEREILNLAVEPGQRRRGIARRLLETELARARGEWFLEVRASNEPALNLYKTLGFQVKGQRTGYYNNPPESGIVMRLVS